MSDNQDKLLRPLPQEAFPWHILASSVRGASHVSSDLPNQDAILWKQNRSKGLPLMVAIADGHGDKKYFRSNIGAQFAVQAAEEILKGFEKGLPDQTLSTIEAAIEHLPRNIVARWRELVEQHWEHTDEFTPREMKWVKNKVNADQWKAITTNPTIPYGATLLTVLVTETFILYLQLGDGDILTVSTSGKVTKPIEDDERLLANETTSLCNPTAARDFRTNFQRLVDPKPALILLSTDGYSNSFRDYEGFLKVGTDIWNMIRSDGLQKVEKSLEEWLSTATQTASGDDITLGLLCRMSALKEEIKLDEQSIQPVGKVDDEEVTSLALKNKTKDEATQTGSGQVDVGSIAPFHSIAPQTADSQGASPPQEAQEQISTLRGVTELSFKQSSLREHSTSEGAKDPAPLQTTSTTNKQDYEALPQPSNAQSTPGVHKDGSLHSEITAPQQVIIVSNSKGEKADWSTISDAIKQAYPGAKILVRPGRYKETLVIDKHVEIIGDGPQREIIIEGNAPCITSQSDSAIVKGITIEGKPTLLSKEKPAVDISRGQLVLSNCNITSETQVCVRVRGLTTHPMITACDIHDCKGVGIEFVENALGLVTDCSIHNHSYAAVEIRGGSNPKIQRCQIYNGKYHGILFWKDGKGKLEDCDIYGNVVYGIHIREGGSPTIHGCKVFGGQGHGILIAENGQATIEDCEIYGNTRSGIDIEQASNADIRGCKVYDGKMSGISFDGGGGIIENCEIYGNADAGIKIEHGGNPSIRRCQIHDGKYVGIAVLERGAGIIEDCEIYRNVGTGVEVKKGSKPLIQISRIRDGLGCGLIFDENSGGRVENCKICGNALAGVKLLKNSHITIKHSDLRGNKVAKILDESSYIEDSKGNSE